MAGTLGEALDILSGLTKPLSSKEREFRAKTNPERWKREILGNPPNSDRFKATLTSSQLNSHQILEEWMANRANNAAFDEDAVSAMKGRQLYPSNPYHERIVALLNLEFSYPAEETPLDLFSSNLEEVRRSALCYASCQRIASACAKSIPLSSPEKTADIIRDLFKYRPKFGASLSPCPWLPEQIGMPYYLWDVENEQTREVTDIFTETGNCPNYVAISHTWGRWIKPEPWIQLLNVPWKIPQNSRFEIKELPIMLRKLGCCYVWLDLLTIPQEESSPVMLERQKIEISRQALIFQNADKSIAWLNDIISWKGLVTSLEWLCLKFLQQSERTALIESILEPMTEKANSHIELCDEPRSRTVFSRRPPNTWFTSLWTLQEACLRPDMWLCNMEWDLICLWDCVPIALCDIVALLSANSHLFASSVPNGVRELDHLFRETRMTGLLQLSRTSIMAMGNERQCLTRRAEAIMSAIGATQWFKTSADETREQDLVFEVYPFDFVNEVREKMGSAAFFSSTPLGWEFQTVLRKFCGHQTYSGELEVLGSMLPFGWGAQNLAYESSSHMAEHSSVKTWLIEKSGMVRINEVSLASSSEATYDTPMNCILAVPSQESGWKKVDVRNMNLHEWIRLYNPHMPNYAVCMLYSPIATRGIVLKEVRPGILIKVGCYWQMESPRAAPLESIVEWLVL